MRCPFAGYLSTVLRELPFDAAQFMLYEHMKSKLREHRGGECSAVIAVSRLE